MNETTFKERMNKQKVESIQADKQTGFTDGKGWATDIANYAELEYLRKFTGEVSDIKQLDDIANADGSIADFTADTKYLHDREYAEAFLEGAMEVYNSYLTNA